MSLHPLHRGISGNDAGSGIPRESVANSGSGALLRLCRPRQWVKNVLVLAAPAAGRLLLNPHAMAQAGLAFVAFCAAASAVYCVNDVIDVQADRVHPVKRLRPVAAGLVRPRGALGLAVVLAVASAVAAVPLGSRFGVILAGYLVLSLAYSTRLKTMPVLEVLAVACGFVLRALAGAAAVGLPPSTWFLMVALFGALFLVAGKRQAEQARTCDVPARSVLTDYPAGWLTQLVTVALTGTVIAYCQWAFQMTGRDISHPLLALSVIPFLAALLRYSMLVTGGRGESPDVLLTTDATLLAAGAGWAVVIFTAIYLT